MKIELWYIGKTSFAYLKEGMAIYEKRLKHYIPLTTVLIPDIKKAQNLRAEQLKDKEGAAVLAKLKPGDYLVLLDEAGKSYTSKQFAAFIEKERNQSRKKMVILIGGAFGFSDALYQRANHKLSLSSMTFSHQMIRLFVLEQIYRAMTILKNEPYHNE